MSKILCIYYSRTGNTRSAMEKIAELVHAELVEITDGKNRSGIFGFLGSGFDAMKKTPEALQDFQTEAPLQSYDHVILATPVWAGRCSSIMRSFLIAHGKELPEKVSYLITRAGDSEYKEVYAQMDQYLEGIHTEEISLQTAASDYYQKLYDFARAITGETLNDAPEIAAAAAGETPKQKTKTKKRKK